MNFSSEVKIVKALDYASGSADRDGATLDTGGFESVALVVQFATIAAGATTSIKAQQGEQSDGSDMADLEGTAISVAADDDNQIFIIDLVKPQERYIRLVVDKDGANATAESAIYMLYGPRVKPTTLTAADAVTYERHISPDEGTA